MRIHIVCHDYQNQERSILARKGRILAEYAGWSISGQPDPRARLNYFFPYIMLSERNAGWDKTLTACYFTHRETNHWKEKQAWFDLAAQTTGLRLTSSRHNLPHLEPHGPTALVDKPPIDRGRFCIQNREPNQTTIIGLSGFVDKRSGRKGEALVAQLAAEDLDCHLRAIGQDWPVPTKLIPFEQIPHYYNSLDYYLCTATLEGVPMTVLEALACGTGVIIPWGVGILDELPNVPGIWRYEKGDYRSLLAAVRTAIAMPKPDREALRAVTEHYTPEQWAADHVCAVESFLYPAEEEPLPSWEGNSGMYCVAFGKPSRKCAVKCIESFKKHHPDVPVAFAGVEPLNAGEDVFCQREDIDIGGRLAKLAVYDAAPADWKYVLYLDADTEVIGNVSFLFKLLADGWEAVICKDMSKYHVARMMKRPDNHKETEETLNLIGCGEVMQYNGGVFGFRRCANTQRFFELWNAEWQKYGARDQGALLRALYQNPLRLFLLGNQWNASDRYPWPVDKIAIVHHNMQARRWGGLIYGRTDDKAAWQRVTQWEAQHR